MLYINCIVFGHFVKYLTSGGSFVKVHIPVIKAKHQLNLVSKTSIYVIELDNDNNEANTFYSRKCCSVYGLLR